MLRVILPLVVFILLVAILAISLTRDPRLVPSPFIGKPAPTFELPQLHDPEKTFGNEVFKGQVSLLNVWASWCVSCRLEHPLFIEIAKRDLLPVYGLNYKDEREDALSWLARLGDPYQAIAFDRSGMVAIDFGVYGAPETFVIDSQGVIAYKHVGPISTQDWKNKILPLILKLQEAES
jgi:cytochrome c biogenesis protein CcmG/thiol:disulfide interchange protein DsbE